MNKFEGSSKYIAGEELLNSVNVAMALQKPLLIKGEPGTGKTMLAEAIAESLGMELIIWSIKSTTKAQDGLYLYDTVQRLYDSQFGEGNVGDIKQYIRLGKLGEAFTSEKQIKTDCLFTLHTQHIFLSGLCSRNSSKKSSASFCSES